MARISLLWECYIVAAPAGIATWLHEPAVLAGLGPGLYLRVSEDRGPLGVRWTATGALVGSCEVWLQPYGNDTIVHCYLRGEPTRPGLTGRGRDSRAAREARRRQHQVSAALWSLKDRLESADAEGLGRRQGPYGSSGRRGLPSRKE